MKQILFIFITIAFLFAAIIFFPRISMTQNPAVSSPDKELCAKMLRFGKEAYLRGKYLDAKEYFRKAVQADSTSLKAWTFYDQAVIFALAEKVEKNANLVLPDASSRHELQAGLSPGAAPPAVASTHEPPASPPKNKGEVKFKIVDDEGC